MPAPIEPTDTAGDLAFAREFVTSLPAGATRQRLADLTSALEAEARRHPAIGGDGRGQRPHPRK